MPFAGVPGPFTKFKKGVMLGNSHVNGSLTLTNTDMLKFQAQGIDHFRLGIAGEYLFTDNTFTAFNTTTLNRIKGIITLLHSIGAIVMIDNHPLLTSTGFQDTIANNVARIQQWWGMVIPQLLSFPSQGIRFEVLNEPSDPTFSNVTGTFWQSFHDSTVQFMRSLDNDPNRKIHVDGQYYADIHGFDNVKLVNNGDPNIWYDAHWYQPMSFTHQGSFLAPFTSFKNVVYPTSPTYIDGQFTAANSTQVSDERTTVYNRAYMLSKLQTLANLAKTRNIPIHIGEFGMSTAAAADSVSAVQWYQDCVSIFNQLGFAYNAFAYQGNSFPITDALFTTLV